MKDQLLSSSGQQRTYRYGTEEKDRERENDTTQPPSELLLLYCFSTLCLVGHIPSICTYLTAMTEGNHVRGITEDETLRVQWGW